MLHRLIVLALLSLTPAFLSLGGCTDNGPTCPVRPGHIVQDRIFAGNYYAEAQPRPMGAIPAPNEAPWSVVENCASFVCAQDTAEATAAFTAAVKANGSNPSNVVVSGPYWNWSYVRAGAMAATAVWEAVGSPCLGSRGLQADAGAQDAGMAKCAWLGDVCNDHFENPDSTVPDCCPTQTVTTRGPSTLICDNNLATGDGICAIDLWQPCNPTVDDCAWLGDYPTTCKGVPGGEFCCANTGQPCYSPGADIPNSGCCNGLSCVLDAIGNGYWCQ